MREIAEIELAIQGGTEKIETLGTISDSRSPVSLRLTRLSAFVTGEQGKVDESMREMQAIEALKTEKGEKERELQQLTETSGASGHQKLRVCDVCGAYLSVLDSDRRLADHFGGKVQSAFFFLPSPSLLGISMCFLTYPLLELCCFASITWLRLTD